MTNQEIINLRLFNQHITHKQFGKPAEVVKWMGAIQAQDYLGSLWSVGLRLKHSKEADIEKAITEKKIVRSWPMRGTLHLVSPDDLRWMLKLLAERVIQRSASMYRKSGLDDKLFSKTKDLFIKAMEGGKQLTRQEMYTILADNKISTGEQRGLHILGHHAQQGLICTGPRKGKQHTFVLLDEWIPSTKTLEKEESLAELTLRYFTSHGPASQKDFMWWSGLSLSETREGIEMCKAQLAQETYNQQIFYMAANTSVKPLPSSECFLLPGFDEYILGYTDRSHVLEDDFKYRIMGNKNGLFNPTIIIAGKVLGCWKRVLKKDNILVETDYFQSVDKSIKSAVHDAVEKYSNFLGLKREVEKKK